MQPNNLALDDYTYATIPTDILAGQAVSLSVQIEADSDFEILKRMVFFSADAFAGLIPLNDAPLMTVQMTDTGSGRDLFNTPILLSNAFGNAQFPFIMQQTKIFSARSVIALTLNNISTVDYRSVQLAFSGRKIFKNRQY
jgi:hypothetical protein